MKLGQKFVKYYVRFLGKGVSRKNVFEVYRPLAKIKYGFYLDTVSLQGFGVDIDQTVELTFTSLAFSVVSQSVIKIKKI